MKNVPKTIYLQIDADGHTPDDFDKLSGVSWCSGKINNNDLEFSYVGKKRTSLQNAALHKLFSDIACQLNNLGHTFNYTGFKGGNMELMYTGVLIKETLWRPIQIALFDIQSTTKLTTQQIDKILDVITKFFGEKGIDIKFPTRIQQAIEALSKRI